MTGKTPVDDETVFMRALGTFVIIWLISVAVLMEITR